MEDRRIFSYHGMENTFILFWRPLTDSLAYTLSPSERGKSNDALFITR